MLDNILKCTESYFYRAEFNYVIFLLTKIYQAYYNNFHLITDLVQDNETFIPLYQYMLHQNIYNLIIHSEDALFQS